MSESYGATFKARYTGERLQWLLGVISVVTLVYLTSGDLSGVFSRQYSNGVLWITFVFYLPLFFSLIWAINLYDIKRLTHSKFVILVVTLVSTIIDIIIISVVELLALLSIGILPQDFIQGALLLLVGALPASLGSVVLSTLSAKTLKERSAKLYEEVRAMHDDLEELQNTHKKTIQKISSLQLENEEIIKKINKNNSK